MVFLCQNLSDSIGFHFFRGRFLFCLIWFDLISIQMLIWFSLIHVIFPQFFVFNERIKTSQHSFVEQKWSSRFRRYSFSFYSPVFLIILEFCFTSCLKGILRVSHPVSILLHFSVILQSYLLHLQSAYSPSLLSLITFSKLNYLLSPSELHFLTFASISPYPGASDSDDRESSNSSGDTKKPKFSFSTGLNSSLSKKGIQIKLGSQAREWDVMISIY